MTVDFPHPHLSDIFVAFVFGVSKILVLTVAPLPHLLKWIMRSPKISKRGDKKKLGSLIVFTVFEYKADIANTCNNSRIPYYL